MFLPDPVPPPEPPSERNRAPETLENSAADPAGAAESYRQSTAVKEPTMRAGPWVRLARTLREAQIPREPSRPTRSWKAGTLNILDVETERVTPPQPPQPDSPPLQITEVTWTYTITGDEGTYTLKTIRSL